MSTGLVTLSETLDLLPGGAKAVHPARNNAAKRTRTEIFNEKDNSSPILDNIFNIIKVCS
jgi:hypothetical protein